ncbi:MAG TPA: hypothetical protein VIK01_29630 [Polyangiaceae bacterium]
MSILVSGGGEHVSLPVAGTHIAGALAVIVGEPITLHSPWPLITGITAIASSPHDLVAAPDEAGLTLRAPGPDDPAGTRRVLELVDGLPIPHAPIEPAPLRIVLSAPGRLVMLVRTADGVDTLITVLACSPECLTFLPDTQHTGGAKTAKRRVLRELARHTDFDGVEISRHNPRQFGA